MAHPALNDLLDYCLRFAQAMLKKRGAFHPFAVQILSSGELSPLAVLPDGENPGFGAMVEQITLILRQRAANGEIQAGAICYDSTLSSDGGRSKKDAVAVALHHSNGECYTVYLPYIKRFLIGYRYDTLIATPGDRKFFL